MRSGSAWAAGGAEAKSRAAAEILLEAHRSGRPVVRIPPEIAPASVEEAYAVQDAVAAGRGPVLGWKTSTGNPPTCSPVFTVLRDGAEVPAGAFHLPKAEVELGFVLQDDLPPRSAPYEDQEVLAVLALAPVMEIVASRYVDRGACTRFEVLADGSNGALLVGEPLLDWRRVDLTALAAELWINGVRAQHAVGGHPLGNPAPLVTWLANHAASHRGGLKRGMVVTTGGLAGATPVGPGDEIVGQWDGLGRIRLKLN